eukprot:7456367-Alexandrium_andersonii.AAC.1
MHCAAINVRFFGRIVLAVGLKVLAARAVPRSPPTAGVVDYLLEALSFSCMPFLTVPISLHSYVAAGGDA